MLLQGALLCLAASAVGLGDPTEVHLRQIVPPVLASFTDQDARVRYYACEALYNIAKVDGKRPRRGLQLSPGHGQGPKVVVRLWRFGLP